MGVRNFQESIAIFLATLCYLTLRSLFFINDFCSHLLGKSTERPKLPIRKVLTYPSRGMPAKSLCMEDDHGLIVLAVHLTLLSVKRDSAMSNVRMGICKQHISQDSTISIQNKDIKVSMSPNLCRLSSQHTNVHIIYVNIRFFLQ